MNGRSVPSRRSSRWSCRARRGRTALVAPTRKAPAPAPILNFDGLDRENWGSGSPPDPNGDVGPNHYIQTVNTSVGIYDKTTASRSRPSPSTP